MSSIDFLSDAMKPGVLSRWKGGPGHGTHCTARQERKMTLIGQFWPELIDENFRLFFPDFCYLMTSVNMKLIHAVLSASLKT